MERFGHSRQKSLLKTAVLSITALFAAILLLLASLSNISKTTSSEEMKSLTTAVNHAVMHCYAVEGRYPESLSYIEAHYGITYDTDKYYIDYRPIASNIKPDITIIYLEDQQ